MKSKKKSKAKLIVALILLVVIAMGALFYYLASELSSISTSQPIKPGVYYKPSFQAMESSEGILFYNYSQDVAPYVLVSYNARNVSKLYLNVSLIASVGIPAKVYVLNTTNECYDCLSQSQFYSDIRSSIPKYGLISVSNISNISISNLNEISNYSVLIVSSGLIPSQFLGGLNSRSSESVLQMLMNKGVTIIYIGDTFSRELLPGSVIEPVTALPSYLATVPYKFNGTSHFYFNSPLAKFATGSVYGPLSYISQSNGTIIAFFNTPSSWHNASAEASDIAYAISKLFWLPRVSSGTEELQGSEIKNYSSIGVVLSVLNSSNLNSSLIMIKNTVGVITAEAVSQSNNAIYSYSYFESPSSINGSISMPPYVVPGQTEPITLEIFTHSVIPISIEPHLSIYNQNMSLEYAVPLQFVQAYGNFTFLKYLTINLPPGNYIASLQGYSGNLYSDALFFVPPINISLSSMNLSNGTLVFVPYAAGRVLQNINYSISMNGAYQSNGSTGTGTIVYKLPQGISVPYGVTTFKISMLSSQFQYKLNRVAPKVVINKQYIELAIVSIVVLLMVTMVKAPNRDEFYIDIPSLPVQDKVNITVPVRDILALFDKQNISYRWKFMPLSKSEIKAAISANIRYNNMPIGVTYNNVDQIVDQLVSLGYLVSADGLYAPSDWVTKSGHDIEYLATFKKLRLYFVTHAYMFTDLDSSNLADIVTTLHGERVYIVIYSKTSKFIKIPIYGNQPTYIAFLNSFKLDEFKEDLYSTYTPEAEQLKIYISSGVVHLISADAPEELGA
ncbi:MAG: hypothetical protein ACP5MX_02100 [Candidatus Micrarchaeia archaeon]